MFRLLCFFILLFSSPALGDVKWQFDAGGPVTGKPLIKGDMVYITGGTTLYALNKAGIEQWRYDSKAPTLSGVTIADHKIYMLAGNGLHAIDMEGHKIWHYNTEDGPFLVEGATWGWGEGLKPDPWSFYRSAPIHVEGKIIFGTTGGTFAIDAKSGNEVWHAKTGQSHTIPVTHEGVLVIGSWDNHLYGLSFEDGAVLWKFTSRLPLGKMAGWIGWEGFNLDPVVDNGAIYAGNRGTYFYKIEAKTGIEIWSTKHSTSWIGSPAIVEGGEVYFGTSDGFSVQGHKVSNGNQTLSFINKFYNFAQPQANKTHLFVPSLSGELFSVDRKSGKSLKLFMTEGHIKNGAKYIKPEGGVRFFHSVEDGGTYENSVKDIKAFLENLDGIMSLTLDGDML